LAHYGRLEVLRASAVPILAKTGTPALVTDHFGWVAAASGLAPVDRIALPERIDDAHAWLPAFGACRLEPVPGGWLIRVCGESDPEPSRTSVDLDLTDSRQARLHIASASGSWSHRVSPRHAEMLFVLANHREGLSAAELSTALFGRAEQVVTVRAETSRLRRHLGGVLLQRPYRFAEWVDVRVDRPERVCDLLPASTAPEVLRFKALLGA
jgi:hypothetical protein